MRGQAPGPFWMVDVFAERKYAGNQLAVFTDAAHLSTAEMQRVARETNFSETTFVVGRSEAGHRVRIFTPAAEIPFAGHPALGTAWVLRETVARGATRVTLDLGVGPISVTFGEEGLLWMRQRAPEFGRRLDRARLARVASLPEDALDPALPVEEVSTGIPFAMVPVRDLASLRAARVDGPAYDAFFAETGLDGIFLFTREPHGPGADLAARMFAPGMGIPEDPATGSANGCLAAYLVQHRALGGPRVDARVDQGVEMGRPSRLHLRAWEEGGAIAVEVGGRVVPVARGEFV